MTASISPEFLALQELLAGRYSSGARGTRT